MPNTVGSGYGSGRGGYQQTPPMNGYQTPNMGFQPQMNQMNGMPNYGNFGGRGNYNSGGGMRGGGMGMRGGRGGMMNMGMGGMNMGGMAGMSNMGMGMPGMGGPMGMQSEFQVIQCVLLADNMPRYPWLCWLRSTLQHVLLSPGARWWQRLWLGLTSGETPATRINRAMVRISKSEGDFHLKADTIFCKNAFAAPLGLTVQVGRLHLPTPYLGHLNSSLDFSRSQRGRTACHLVCVF